MKTKNGLVGKKKNKTKKKTKDLILATFTAQKNP